MRALLAASIVLAVFGACANAGDKQSAGADRTVVIQMRDSHFEPDRLKVRRGETIAFRFQNRGQMRHDAFIGDEKAQGDHEDEARMAEDAEHGAGHTVEEGDALTVEPGDTGRLTHRFIERGEIFIGCHEPGHYKGGMVLTVRVE